jgi:phosphoesterase RecJ-like protein
LRAAGRRSIASFPKPFRVAAHYRELPGLELLVPPEEFPAEPEVMVTFDCGSLDRLGMLRPAAEAARELVVVDHHVSNDRYGTLNVIDPYAAASGVLVRRLIDRLGLPLNDAAAVCLYAALICDTGRFQYETTDAGVFDLAGELVGYDVPVSRLSRTLFEEHRFAYLQLLAEAVANAELVREQSFVWAAVTQDMLSRHDVSLEEVEGLIDIIRRTAEADVACVLKEESNGTVKVSLRSVGAADVRHIAAAHGGGGHRFAAGFTSEAGIAETVERIRAAL